VKDVIQKLQKMLQEAEARRTWGNIEISLRDGQAVLLRQMTQFKLEEEQSPNAYYRK
jgi:hypothetical protein